MNPIIFVVVAVVVLIAVFLVLRSRNQGGQQITGEETKNLPKPDPNTQQTQTGKEQTGKEQTGKEKPGKEQTGKEQTGKDRAGKEPTDKQPETSSVKAPKEKDPKTEEGTVSASSQESKPTGQKTSIPPASSTPTTTASGDNVPVETQSSAGTERTSKPPKTSAAASTENPGRSNVAAEIPVETVEGGISEAVMPPPKAAVTRQPQAKKDLSALKKGLQQTRGGWVNRLLGVFSGKKEIDPELVTQIEETLITGDVGLETTQRLVAVIKERLSKKDLSNEDLIWETLKKTSREVLDVSAPKFASKAKPGEPNVILVVGVNGAGKTTTIGKLAARYKDQGKSVYLAAADTFRAAAVAQIEMWGKRVGVPVVKGKDLSKPSSVVYDAVQIGLKERADVVIADTAGRLHTKTPLMDELRKLRDAASKALPGAPHEILLVLDSTTGQNGVIQVKEFREALDLTGIVLTKLDGTAKGGVILGICDEFKLPVRFVGVGEKVDDLREFDPDDFTNALFANGDESEVA